MPSNLFYFNFCLAMNLGEKQEPQQSQQSHGLPFAMTFFT
jgi:hypothetical protein